MHHQRLAAKRSRRGCATCKARKVRCDETFQTVEDGPTVFVGCQKCRRTGRKCEGPSFDGLVVKAYEPKTASTAKLLVLAKPVSRLPSPLEVNDSRAYDFFLRVAADGLSKGMDDGFWGYLLPQLCEYDETIRHAILALSALHEHPICDGTNIQYTEEQARGVTWYKSSIRKAMVFAADRNEDEQMEYSLLTCLLFAIIEMQHANYSGSKILLTHGLHLISRYRHKYPHGRTAAPLWFQDILPIFGHQLLSIGIFRSEISPRYNGIVNDLLRPTNTKVASLKDARDALLATAHDTMQLAVVIASSGAAMCKCERLVLDNLRASQLQMLDRLHNLKIEILRLELSVVRTDVQKVVYHSLLCFLKFITMWIFWILSPPQDLATQDSETVKELLDHAESALFYSAITSTSKSAAPVTLEIGVTGPICFVFWSCRTDLDITSRASRLLHQASRLENIYVARLQADVVGRLLGIEAGLSLGSGRGTFEQEVHAWSYSWTQVATDALNGIRRTKKWSWEDEMLPEGVDLSLSKASPASSWSSSGYHAAGTEVAG